MDEGPAVAIPLFSGQFAYVRGSSSGQYSGCTAPAIARSASIGSSRILTTRRQAVLPFST